MSLSRLRNWDPFSDEAANSDIKGKSIKGGVWTIVGQGGAFALQMIRIVVLARLLTPEDFGLIGMAVILSGMLEIFKDGGLSMATIQAKSVSHEQISSLFWINILISLGLASVMAAASPLVVLCFGQEDLLLITLVLSLSFPVSGLALQHQALLRRQMRFRTLTVVQMLSTAIALFAAVSVALCGGGYWALVVSQIILSASSAILFWLAVPWCPGKFRRGRGVKSMLSFGGHLTGNSLLFRLLDLYPNFLVGRYYGSEALGLFERARQLLATPIRQATGPINAVALPALSRLADEPSRYLSYVSHQWNLTRCIMTPLFCCVLVMHDWIVDIMLGPQWGELKPLFLLFSLGALANVGIWIVPCIMISQGRAKELFSLHKIRVPLRLIGITVGALYGLKALVAIDAMVATLMVFFMIWKCGRVGPVSCRFLSGGYLLYTFMLGVAIALGGCFRLSIASVEMGGGTRIFLVGTVCLIASLLAIVIIPGNRRSILVVLGTLRNTLLR